MELLKKTRVKVKPVLSRNIQAFRKNLGMKQQELALRTGVHLNTIKMIEGGHSEGTPENRAKIAAELGTTVSELYRDGDQKGLKKLVPDFSGAVEFLELFRSLSPDRKALVSMLVYDDPAYLAGNPDLARVVSNLLKD